MITESLMIDLTRNKDKLLSDAIESKGFDSSDVEWIKANITLVSAEGDKFEHVYAYETIRIISIQRIPTIHYEIENNNYKLTAEFKYY